MRTRPPHFLLMVARLLLALWLVIGPFVLGFGWTAPQRQDFVAGFLLLPLAALGLLVHGPVRVWLLAVGAWLVLAPDLSGWYFLSETAVWHDRIVGLLAIFLGLLPLHYEGEAHQEKVPAGEEKPRFGLAPRPGWTGLWRRNPAAR